MECQLKFEAISIYPKHATFEMFEGGTKKKSNHIKLYARQLFIMSNSVDTMPKWHQFVKGVVDSGNLPLNISHVTLLQKKILPVNHSVKFQAANILPSKYWRSAGYLSHLSAPPNSTRPM
eukprot:3457160-Ditylum_brightwellii.AAC.1